MPRYECPECNHRWRGRGRKPGGEVYCPKCGKRVYTYAKAVRPMTPEREGGRPAMSWRRKEVDPSERP